MKEREGEGVGESESIANTLNSFNYNQSGRTIGLYKRSTATATATATTSHESTQSMCCTYGDRWHVIPAGKH